MKRETQRQMLDRIERERREAFAAQMAERRARVHEHACCECGNALGAFNALQCAWSPGHSMMYAVANACDACTQIVLANLTARHAAAGQVDQDRGQRNFNPLPAAVEAATAGRRQAAQLEAFNRFQGD